MCQFSDVNLLWCVEIDICNVQYFFFQKKKVQKCVRHNEYLKAISFGQWEGHKGCQSSLQWECGKQWLYNNVAVHEWFYCLCGHKWIVVMLPKKERGGGAIIYLQCVSRSWEPFCQCSFFFFFYQHRQNFRCWKKNTQKWSQSKVVLMLAVQLHTEGIPASLSLHCPDTVWMLMVQLLFCTHLPEC